jgi:nucleoside diphosphate kinase
MEHLKPLECGGNLFFGTPATLASDDAMIRADGVSPMAAPPGPATLGLGLRGRSSQKRRVGGERVVAKPVEATPVATAVSQMPAASTTTLAIIKPDAVAANAVAQIEELIEANNFGILARMETRLSPVQAAHLCESAQGSPEFDAIVAFMSSGPIVALALTQANGLAAWLDLLGPADSGKAAAEAPGSVRALFGTDAIRNACHGSATAAAAYRELKLFFPKTFPRELSVALVLPTAAAAASGSSSSGEALGGAAAALKRMASTHEFLPLACTELSLSAAQVARLSASQPLASPAQLSAGPVWALLVEKSFATEDLLALIPPPYSAAGDKPAPSEPSVAAMSAALGETLTVVSSASPSAAKLEATLLFGKVDTPTLSFALIQPDAITRADEVRSEPAPTAAPNAISPPRRDHHDVTITT